MGFAKAYLIWLDQFYFTLKNNDILTSDDSSNLKNLSIDKISRSASIAVSAPIKFPATKISRPTPSATIKFQLCCFLNHLQSQIAWINFISR